MANDPQSNNILNMSALGDKLREARERKNLTLDQAQKQTRINSSILKALEEGRCDSVLNPTYVKSFLKKYAEFLSLDPNQVLNDYKKLHPDTEVVPEPKTEDAPVRDISRAVTAIKLIAVSLITVALVLFIGGKISAYLKKRSTARAAVTMKAKKLSTAKAPKKVTQKRSTPKKEPEAIVPKNVPLKLLLKVNQTVLVKMRTDGNLLFERVLSKGTAEMFSAENTINIYVAKGESIELILNGKSLGSPGNGLLKNVEITRTGVKVK